VEKSNHFLVVNWSKFGDLQMLLPFFYFHKLKKKKMFIKELVDGETK